MLIDCPANSGAAETHTAKWQLPLSNTQCVCYGAGSRNHLFKCKDITVGNVENKLLEESPLRDGWNEIAPSWMCGAPSLVTRWLELSSFKRRPWTIEIISTYFRCLQSCRWHTFNQTSSFNKMVPLLTGVWHWESVRIKRFPTDRLGVVAHPATPSPPRHIISLDFFFRDYVKEHLFRPKLCSMIEFRARINS